jgi:hypothetical protein
MENVEKLKKIFDSNFQWSPGCWLWKGGHYPQGYGRIMIDGTTWVASRLSYTVYKNPIPKGLLVRHRCDNPRCVNPDHLLLGTHQDNTEDKIERGRHSHGESHAAAKLTEDQVRKIRQLKASGYKTIASLAKAYDMHPHTIRLIISRRLWARVR